MKLPTAVRDHLVEILWQQADSLGWSSLPDSERSKWYEAWVRDSRIGGVLAQYMDPRRIRVYVKDSLLKPYLRTRSEEIEGSVRTCLGISENIAVKIVFVKPHGRVLITGQLFCWGSSRDWKQILMAAFERTSIARGRASVGVVLFETGKSLDAKTRAVIREAANRLEIGKVAWLE